jgi:hypothetical protein
MMVQAFAVYGLLFHWHAHIHAQEKAEKGALQLVATMKAWHVVVAVSRSLTNTKAEK